MRFAYRWVMSSNGSHTVCATAIVIAHDDHVAALIHDTRSDGSMTALVA
jgi:hypothetical protein